MLRRHLTPRLLICFLLFAATAHLPGVCAQDEDARQGQRHARREIAALENQWKVATLTGDVGAMDKLLSDDFVGITWTGQVNTKTMQLDRARTKGQVITRMDLSDVKIKILQSVAIVTSLASVEGTNDGHSINGDFRYTRIYARRPSGAWQITNFEATKIPPSRAPGQHGHLPPSPPPAPR
jgi:ketosteroid isomerase-like protein